MRDDDMIEGTRLRVWSERDELVVELVDRDDETVGVWRDDDARALVDDGFMRNHDDHAGLVKHCRELGIIRNVVTVYSIDATREADGGWTENDVHWRRTYVNVPDEPRALFAWMRARGMLSDYSKGRVEYDRTMDWVCERSNRRPLFGITTNED